MKYYSLSTKFPEFSGNFTEIPRVFNNPEQATAKQYQSNKTCKLKKNFMDTRSILCKSKRRKGFR